MPIGTPKYFYGHKDLKNIFGFIKCVVYAPDIYCPVLLTKLNNRSIAPVGTWTDVYFSEEMKYAESLGYTFDILEGVEFDKDIISNNFINTLYKFRLMYNKEESLNLISKLLMNTSYGRFGMSPYIHEYKIINSLKADKINYLDNIYLGYNNELLSTLKVNNINNNNFMMPISISIASAITAYARIEINKIKNQFIDNLYYSDTDSGYFDIQLPNHLINNELGGLKLESIFKKALFLLPKVYGGVLIDNKEIIKIKGFKGNITFNELESLLIKNSKLELNHTKWFRNFNLGHITLKQILYTLILNENKRHLIYNENNKFIDTKPIKINKPHHS